MPKPRFYILFVLLLCQWVHGQDAKRYSFAHYTNASGLASNEVMSVIQDDEGYIWIATTNGLQRFDGVRFITFRNRKNDPSSIPANFVSELMIDKDRNLWVTIGGLHTGIFDRKNFTFHEVPIKPTKESSIYADKFMSQDESGNIYILLWNIELLKFDRAKQAFLPTDLFRLPEGWKISGFCQLPGTKKYIVGTNNGTAIYNAQTGITNYTGHNIEREEFVEQMGKTRQGENFMVDMKGRLWYNTWETGGSTLCCYDTKSNSFFIKNRDLQPMLTSYHELKGVMEQRNGDLWVKGLNIFARYIEKDKQFQLVYNGYESEQSISFNRVYCLFEDKEQNIWVATDRDGLYMFNPREQFFNNIRQVNRITKKLGNGGVMSFMPTRNGDILVGIWEDGFYRYDSNYNNKPVNLPLIEKHNPSVWGMFQSKDGHTVWMGAQPGIWRYDQNTEAVEFFNPEALKGRTVRQVAEDNSGNLWIGTQSIGLFKWTKDKGKQKFNDGITFYDPVPSGMINCIRIDSSGLVWVGTPSAGAYVIDPSTNKLLMHFGTKEPEERRLRWDGIASTMQFDDSTIIIAANGLSLYNTRQKKITQTIILPDIFTGAVTAMEKDRQGYLWVSSTGGLYRVNVHSKIFIRFDRTDGIANDRFIVSSSYVLPDGQILFGADNQFVAFNPRQVQINDMSPDIRITGFKLANESLQLDSLLKKKRIELAPDDNSLTIEFSGLSFTSAYIIRYKLENLDKEWKIADKNYQAIYSYLPPGTYTFLVRSEDAEGIPDKNITRLVIHVNPPFWKTWWFFCLLALVIAAVIFWLDRERVKRLIALQKVRTDIASNLHEEVNTTLNNINLLSEMARIKADKDVDRSKEFIEQISSKSHNMILAMDDILWSIDPHNDSMEKSLLRMMEFADVLKNLFAANIELALDKKVRSLKLDMKTRHDVFLIFKEALRLIVEFAGGSETIIHIDLFKNKLSLKLQDATASFEKNTEQIDRSIQEMSGKAGTINADLDVQYDKKGIAIILLVPVKGVVSR